MLGDNDRLVETHMGYARFFSPQTESALVQLAWIGKHGRGPGWTWLDLGAYEHNLCQFN